jgi:hypothetical protein
VNKNYLLIGGLIGAVIGVFFTLFGPNILYEAFRDNVLLLALIFIFVLVLTALLLCYQEPILKFLFGAKRQNLKQVLDDISDAMESLPIFFNTEGGKRISHAVRQGGTLYLSWSLRLLIFRTIIGCTVALGGIFGSYILIKQTEVMSKQSESLDVQNALSSLNFVSNLRDRLKKDKIAIFPVWELSQFNFVLDDSVPAVSSNYLDRLKPELYSHPNQSDVQALSDIALSPELSDRMVRALEHLLKDDDPSVVIAALEVLNLAKKLRNGMKVTIKNAYIHELTLDSSAHITFENSIVQSFTCSQCNVSSTSSILVKPHVSQFSEIHSSIIDFHNIMKFDNTQGDDLAPSSYTVTDINAEVDSLLKANMFDSLIIIPAETESSGVRPETLSSRLAANSRLYNNEPGISFNGKVMFADLVPGINQSADEVNFRIAGYWFYSLKYNNPNVSGYGSVNAVTEEEMAAFHLSQLALSIPFINYQKDLPKH